LADANRRLYETIAALPSHLGWGSAALTAVLRRQLLHQQEKANCANHNHNLEWLERLAGEQRSRGAEEKSGAWRAESGESPSFQSLAHNPQSTICNPQSNDWVKLYPAIGLGMLRQELTAPGRLWLLLRYLDQPGSGSIRIATVIKQLTEKSSPLYLCGKRQLRNLLHDGEGVYWIRNKERLWLRSAAKVAYALDVERLTGQPVALSLSVLLDGIGAFRAHLYAAFHSGRTKVTPYNEQAMPISRETMTKLSRVGQSSQRIYEEQAGVQVQANFAIGERATKENKQNCAWTRGQALFELKDYRGQQGKKGKRYLAWQLPNSYVGQHQRRPKGRQKRINRELQDLVMKGMPGNVGQTSESRQPEKVYYPTGKLAAKVYGRDPERELYWGRQRTRNGRFSIWQQMGSRP
jgi:hypothetical protein